MPPLEPVQAKEMKTFNFQQGPVILKTKPENVVLKGLKGLKLKAVRTDIKKDDSLRMEIDLEVPLLEINADYKALGNFNAFKLKAKGHAIIVISKIFFWSAFKKLRLESNFVI